MPRTLKRDLDGNQRTQKQAVYFEHDFAAQDVLKCTA